MRMKGQKCLGGINKEIEIASTWEICFKEEWMLLRAREGAPQAHSRAISYIM